MTDGTRSDGDSSGVAASGNGGDSVPRLPRGRGLRLSRPELVRILLLATLLVFLVATQRQCAGAISSLVTGFGDQGPVDIPGSGGSGGSGAGAATPSGHPEDYERLRPGMTDAELKAAIERARARAHGSAAQPAGSAAQP